MLKKMECFVCGKVSENVQTVCSTCNWHKCPACGGCLCNLSEGEKKIALAVYRTQFWEVG